MSHSPPPAEAGGYRLARETSPYLRQHARNPVEWFPWGEEALARARELDRPILLSIGYSACHWCHVMERESFENPAIAALMNEHFVCIKVDREERPDLDAIYMNAVQLMTGSGGWPLTVFLTPDGRPFFGGTYFPPDDRHGRAGFPRVLTAIARAYREGASEVGRNVDALAGALRQLSHFEPTPDDPAADVVAAAEERLLALADAENGGFGGAPKFPCASALALLLRRHLETGRSEPLDALRRSLDAMARGGIYDHLGGGFHRYSVDARWLVPHFEKMLYDNALLAQLYADAFAATGEERYRRVAAETLGYLLRDMRHPAGGFFSSQDADTQGEEGATYLWRPEEIRRLLGERGADLFCRAYGVDDAGNFTPPGSSESRSILHRVASDEDLARLFSMDPAAVRRELDAARRVLLDTRQRRPQPARDEKVLTAWNALAIRALVRAANVLGDEAYLEAARETAAFLDRELAAPGGRVRRSWRDGDARHAGCLDDHAFLGAASLDLFEATGERSFLDRARDLARILVERFADREAGGFFLTSDDHERLIDRPKLVFDASLPSGNAVATEVLVRLAALGGAGELRELAGRTLRLFAERMRADPFGTAALVSVLGDFIAEPLEIVIAGERSDEATRALVSAAYASPSTARSVLVTPPATAEPERVEAARGKTPVRGRPAAYVCRSLRCSEPVVEPSELRAALAAP